MRANTKIDVLSSDCKLHIYPLDFDFSRWCFHWLDGDKREEQTTSDRETSDEARYSPQSPRHRGMLQRLLVRFQNQHNDQEREYELR